VSFFQSPYGLSGAAAGLADADLSSGFFSGYFFFASAPDASSGRSSRAPMIATRRAGQLGNT